MLYRMVYNEFPFDELKDTYRFDLPLFKNPNAPLIQALLTAVLTNGKDPNTRIKIDLLIKITEFII